jgi:septal ring factor EnvC (AmiA/AmiB activator)
MVKIFVVFVALLAAMPLFAQDAIKEMERKKQQMESDINYTSTLINQTQQKQRASVEHLELVKANIDKRRSLLKSIDARLLSLEQEIAMRQKKTVELSGNMEVLKEKYAQMLQVAYRSRNSYSQLMYVLASDNINQAYRRITYLRNFSDALLEHAHNIAVQNQALTAEITALQKSKLEQEILLRQKKEEVAELDDEVKNYEYIVAVLKKQQSVLMQDLEVKKQQAALLNRQIESAIAEEARREQERRQLEREHAERIERERLAAELKKNKGKVTTPPPPRTVPVVDSRFEKLRGALALPVNKGVIVTKFGVHNHPVFQHIHVTSNGIDISTNVGAVVNVVADGIVRKIFTTNAVTSILVQHDIYYTVYTHVTNVRVSMGDMVRAGQPLGLVDLTNDKAILHFELWKQMEKQDPEAWLAKR